MRFNLHAIRLSLRQQLLLISLILLIIPLLGSSYINELENFLRHDQEQRLLENARMVATAISTQAPTALELEASNRQRSGDLQRFIRPLKGPIFLDGYTDDWNEYGDRLEHYPKASAKPSGHSGGVDRVSFDVLSGYYQRRIYFMLQVHDRHPLYRHAPDNVTQADHIVIVSENDSGATSYILSTFSPGLIQAVTLQKREDEADLIRVEPRITAVWTETSVGYNIEIQIPESLLHNRFSLQFHNLNADGSEQVISLHPHNLTQTIPINLPSKPLQKALSNFSSHNGRAWLINRDAKIVGLQGSIFDSPTDDTPDNVDDQGLGQVIYDLARLFYLLFLPQPSELFVDDTVAVSALSGPEIDNGLKGVATTHWRLTDNERVNILRAVQPVFSQGRVIGAVVLERNSNSILLLQNRAVEVLMNTSIIVFALSTLTLLAFATRLSYRIQRLRDETEDVISDDGRIKGSLSAQPGNDEIGDLRASFNALLARLQEYNRYLEGMASKLSHELRTPVTVVKSSLENLDQSSLDDDQSTYLQRAQDGVDRLNHLLTRMSEATRLEQSLLNEPRQEFSLRQVVEACANAYNDIHEKHQIQLIVDAPLAKNPLKCHGSPDLIAQMLDKLVSNALDFATPESAIDIVLQPTEAGIELLVRNLGPTLPKSMQANLFDSMVSVRDKASGDKPHLGLGLYIVRLIAQFHSGKPFARNLKSQEDVQSASDNEDNGVEIGVEIPNSAFREPSASELE